jgi:hypothetical protein
VIFPENTCWILMQLEKHETLKDFKQLAGTQSPTASYHLKWLRAR